MNILSQEPTNFKISYFVTFIIKTMDLVLSSFQKISKSLFVFRDKYFLHLYLTNGLLYLIILLLNILTIFDVPSRIWIRLYYQAINHIRYDLCFFPRDLSIIISVLFSSSNIKHISCKKRFVLDHSIVV